MRRLLPGLFALAFFFSAAPAYATVCGAAWAPHHGLGTLGFAATTIPAYFAPEGRVGLGLGLGFFDQEIAGSDNPTQLQAGIATSGRASGDWGGLGYDVVYRSRTESGCSSRGRTHATVAASYGLDLGAVVSFRVGTGPVIGLEDSETAVAGLGAFGRLTTDLPLILLDLELQTSGTVGAGEFLLTLTPTARMTIDIPFAVQPVLLADYEFIPEAAYSAGDSFQDRETHSNWNVTVGASVAW